MCPLLALYISSHCHLMNTELCANLSPSKDTTGVLLPTATDGQCGPSPAQNLAVFRAALSSKEGLNLPKRGGSSSIFESRASTE